MTDTTEGMPIDEAIREAEETERRAWHEYRVSQYGSEAAKATLAMTETAVARLAALRAARARGETHVPRSGG